jgi:hypothetical protein
VKGFVGQGVCLSTVPCQDEEIDRGASRMVWESRHNPRLRFLGKDRLRAGSAGSLTGTGKWLWLLDEMKHAVKTWFVV